MERIKQITSHLEPSPRAKLLQRQEDDIVLCSAVRTPLTRARKGGLANTSTDVLLSTVLKEVVNKVSLDPKLVEDIM
ncbi:hypothetical protein DL96DRAFT_1051055 [Flagelloscypha sp. PMI_526]|nr:hypothetical protein DL96DRAFT_1051055 [Flagelloscypha sp. PMI_526]